MPETVINPPKRLVSVNLPELWRYRDLFVVLSWRDIAVRYKQTALGVLWAVFQPVVSMIVFTYIFNGLAQIPSGDKTPYPIFLLVGLLLWQYYANALTKASNSLLTNAPLVQKIYFPRLILPATASITGLVDFGIASVVLAAMMAYYGYAPKLLGILILPLLLLAAILSSLGVGLFLAAVHIKYHDVAQVLPFLIQTLFFVTPVIYPVSLLNRHPLVQSLMLWFNPISGVITTARAGLLGQGAVDWRVLGISLLMSAVFFLFGLFYFRATERYFADLA